jgi:N-glycosylase/DNA lyase
MTEERIEQVAESLVSLGYEGVVQFDRTEPEYSFIVAACEEFDSDAHVALLSILAATQDYQLAGDAQRFWRTLEDSLQERENLASESDVKETLAEFMDQPVNARLREQKKDRLVRMVDYGFGEWFLESYPDVDPVRVWEEIAAALDTTQEKKTVVLAMKIYDIFHLILNGEYLALPMGVPIPCDLQVERVAAASGIVEQDEKESVMEAWARVMEQVNAELDRPVSMLRIDSIVWQCRTDHLGQQRPS